MVSYCIFLLWEKGKLLKGLDTLNDALLIGKGGKGKTPLKFLRLS